MKIKNYTSGVPSDKSISMIERELIELGATGIQKDIRDGAVAALSFSVKIEGQKIISYRLPARVSNVHGILKTSKPIRKSNAGRKRKQPLEETIKEQAERTAWKIILDWVLAQGALIRLGQSSASEVFLPYMLVGKGAQQATLWAHMSSRGMQNFLLEGPK